MPELQALHHTGRLKARPEIARQLIFGALNWTAQWFSERGSLTLDALLNNAGGQYISPADQYHSQKLAGGFGHQSHGRLPGGAGRRHREHGGRHVGLHARHGPQRRSACGYGRFHRNCSCRRGFAWCALECARAGLHRLDRHGPLPAGSRRHAAQYAGHRARGPLWQREGRLLGYFKDSKAMEEAQKFGWHHSSDLGMWDAQGRMEFIDRKKDMIKTGGENVASVKVGAVVLAHPEVAAAAVFGLPHPHWSEAVCAFVVRKPGTAVDAESVLAHCRNHLSGFEVPKLVHFVEAFPSTATGKVQKNVMRKQFEQVARELWQG